MRKIWDLAWPVMILGLSRVVMRASDLLIVGFLGAWAAAAVGLGDVWMRIVLFAGLGIGAGTVARISQGIGSGRSRQVRGAMTQSVLIAVVLGGIVSTVLWFHADWLVEILGPSERVVREGGTYLRIVGLSAAPRILYLVTFRGMAARGDTITPMIIGFVTTALNVGGTILLVFGLWGLPELGVTGAALATAMGNTLAGGTCLFLLVNAWYPLSVDWPGISQFREGWKVIRIGTPRVASGAITAIADVPFSSILLWFGDDAVAGYQIARRIQMLARMPNWGISMAASTYSGQAIGATRPGQSRREGWKAVKLALLVSLPITLLLAVGNYPLGWAFIREEPALTLARHFIVVFAFVTLALAVEHNLAGALEGAGHTMVPMLGNLTGVSVLLAGSALLAGYSGYGMEALYGSVIVGYGIRTLIVLIWYVKAPWARSASRQLTSRPSDPSADRSVDDPEAH